MLILSHAQAAENWTKCYLLKGHPKSWTVLKSHYWLKISAPVKWGISNSWIFPSDEANSVVYKTNKTRLTMTYGRGVISICGGGIRGRVFYQQGYTVLLLSGALTDQNIFLRGGLELFEVVNMTKTNLWRKLVNKGIIFLFS